VAELAVQVNDINTQSVRAVTSRDSAPPNQDDQIAAADDDASDDYQALACAWDWLPAIDVTAPLLWSEPTLDQSQSAASRTFESQHILLRL
jgi:hypothetical protein